MKVGFVGYGEAGFELSKGLKKEGIKEIIVYDKIINNPEKKEVLISKAKEADVFIVNDPKEVMKAVNIIFVAVPAQYSLVACRELETEIDSNTVYVDVAASSPQTKLNIESIVKERNGHYVDAAMLGPLTVHQHKVPIVASGNGTKIFIELMTPFGMAIQYISEKAGDASSIKLLRSIYMKGTAALLVEVLEAAKYLKLEEQVIHSLKETMEESSFERLLNQLITGTSIHAARRAHELEGSLDILRTYNLRSEMTNATKMKLEYISHLNLKQEWNDRRPKEWQTVIEKILTVNRGDFV
ncbi:NAD(P)-binding domain-containing protein [Alkalihalophilus marmarensis]|uniref:3-hydroxyisobutyrate dehydrogenase n=1 Tax=Alkalihalophilus marmarensis DSM 21297 TaxID=1188261 RepID=U6SK38_9BACI|nr:DUF1932 domain-containing protein [Alkalihalophilus marmarensis]ERN51295.1 hypothetical protein A33I_20665 [Alkalihalophilus marmarensis DSM 21297]MCM3491587.1 NAD(P)-binding domain-containing protein [Alkalihalophilus marmarensis]